MEKHRYTPGPWAVPHKDSPYWLQADKGEQHIPVSSGMGRIAIVNWQRREHEANARLIAAAPDLLAALEGCLGYFRDMANQNGGDKFAPDAAWLKPLECAIAKAKGAGK